MICSTLTPNRSGKENPCYTQIRLQTIRILEIRELHNGWLQCGLNVINRKVFGKTVASGLVFGPSGAVMTIAKLDNVHAEHTTTKGDFLAKSPFVYCKKQL